MSSLNDDSWLFVAEWYDPMPQLKRKYLMKYFPKQNQVELIDVKSRKLFLKKSPCPPELSPTDFFVGGRVLLYSRELDIVDFGDETTRTKLSFQAQQTALLLSSELYSNWGKIIDSVLDTNSFNLVSLKSYQFSPSLADTICNIFGISGRVSRTLCDGVSVILIASKEDGIEKMKTLLQDLTSEFGNGSSVWSGLSAIRSGSDLTELQGAIESSRIPTSATLDSCTCCVIKPHAVKSKAVGKILDIIIGQGYDVSAISNVHFDKVQAEEFYEVYKGVVPEYADHVVQLCGGMSVALEIRAVDPVATFRQTAGPWDVQMAKELRPTTIRALYGHDLIRNAVHCTDLDSDGIGECEYCFKLLP